VWQREQRAESRKQRAESRELAYSASCTSHSPLPSSPPPAPHALGRVRDRPCWGEEGRAAYAPLPESTPVAASVPALAPMSVPKYVSDVYVYVYVYV
jgi:hypothetical protein